MMAYHEDIVRNQEGKKKCELCKIFIGEVDGAIEDHLDDKQHIMLFMKRIMIQNSITTHKDKYLCGLCKNVFEINNMTDHIKSQHHEDLILDVKKMVLKDGGFLILPEDINSLGTAVNCLICNCNMQFDLNIIKTHITSERHRRARSIAVQPLNAIFSVEDSDEDLWCKICQVYIENYVEVILEHVDEDPKHVKEITKIFLLTKDEGIDVTKYFVDPKEFKAMCNKCGFELPCNILNLGEHINGNKHKFAQK